jgi:hypothetical protein
LQLALPDILVGLTNGRYREDPAVICTTNASRPTPQAFKPEGSIEKMRQCCCILTTILLLGCGEKMQSACGDPTAQSGEYMTETEKKLARLKKGFDPNCK